MRFALINKASPGALGGGITSEALSAIAAALQIQLNRDVATWWGGSYSVRAGTDADIAPGEIVASIVDALPDAPGAVAYHDVQGADVPVVYVAASMCSTVSSGSDSLSSAMSHELCEAAGDPFCNAWRDDGRGAEWCQELCDATQEDGYEINGIAVSNFLLPAFFAPAAAGPYSYLGATTSSDPVSAPFAIASGGYQIKRSAGSDETQVTGSLGRRAAKAAHWSSRPHRRGVRSGH